MSAGSTGQRTIKIDLPLRVVLPRKRTVDKSFILNLNNYRNTHYQVLDQAKKVYADEVYAILLAKGVKSIKTPVRMSYTLFPATNRLCDIGNVLSIVQKFTEDALVDCGIIPNDNYEHIPDISHHMGSVDKANPRVELVIDAA